MQIESWGLGLWCLIFCFFLRFFYCSDSVVVFVFLLDFRNVPTMWYFLFFYCILEMFRQCGIFCFSIGFWKCSDSVIFLVFLLDFGNVPTVWYLLFFYWIYIILSEHFQNPIEKQKIPHCRNISKIQ
jgi:hypothetical protein